MEETTPAPTYAVVAGDVGHDREAVLSVWHGSLGQSERMHAKFDWFYAACPYGQPLLCLLQHLPTASTVGVASAGPRRMLWRQAPVEAGLLVDLAVRAEHRSLGPALMLQGALAHAGRERFDLLYGFPNPKAAAVFKRVGYARLGELVRHARVLRHANYLARKLPRVLVPIAAAFIDLGVRVRDGWRARGDRALVATWVEHADARFDALWHLSPKPEALVAVRDAAFARWRFDASPLASTRYLLVNDRETGALRAWFACEAIDDVLHVRDFWSDDAASGIGRPYVDALVRAARRSGHAGLSVEYAGATENLHGWRQCRFVERSRRPIFGAWSDARTDTDLHLTAADEDE